jgi:hypothetical protein
LENTLNQYNLPAITNFLLSKEMLIGNIGTGQSGSKALQTRGQLGNNNCSNDHGSKQSNSNNKGQGKNNGQQCNQGQRRDLVKRGNSSSVPPTRPLNSQASTKSWCKFHKSTTHNTMDCKEHLAHIQELQDMTKASKAHITNGLADS